MTPPSTPTDSASVPTRIVGRYDLHQPIAAGGMAVVHLGRLMGAVGFARTVAIKRLHPQYAFDKEFVAMFVDEARLAARIHHPNVVSTLDVVVDGTEVLLVMEYVHGEALSRLMRARPKLPFPPRIASAVLTGALHGLHAAHEAKNEQGELIGLIHRDVSPQNVLVGADGIARVLDFGIAKAAGRLQTTQDGKIKGKLAYMAPEQILGEPVTRRVDVYAASVVAWELLAGKRLFFDENEGAIIQKVLQGTVDPPSKYADGVSPELDAIVLRGLSRSADARFATTQEMALALEQCVAPALASEVARFVADNASDSLKTRSDAIATMEKAPHEPASVPSGVSASTLVVDDAGTRSQLSVTPAVPRAFRSRWPAFALGGATVVALALLTASRATRGTDPSAVPTSTPSSVGPGAIPGPLAAPSSVSSNSPPPAAARSAGESPAPSRDAPPPVPTASATPSAARARGTGRGDTKRPSAGCDPPFTVDSIGRRIYKRECF